MVCQRLQEEVELEGNCSAGVTGILLSGLWLDGLVTGIQELPSSPPARRGALGIVHHQDVDGRRATRPFQPSCLRHHALLVCTCALVGCEGMLRAGRERVGVRIGFGLAAAPGLAAALMEVFRASALFFFLPRPRRAVVAC